jgi:hypothetical protein
MRKKYFEIYNGLELFTREFFAFIAEVQSLIRYTLIGLTDREVFYLSFLRSASLASVSFYSWTAWTIYATRSMIFIF